MERFELYEYEHSYYVRNQDGMYLKQNGKLAAARNDTVVSFRSQTEGQLTVQMLNMSKNTLVLALTYLLFIWARKSSISKTELADILSRFNGKENENG